MGVSPVQVRCINPYNTASGGPTIRVGWLLTNLLIYLARRKTSILSWIFAASASTVPSDSGLTVLSRV